MNTVLILSSLVPVVCKSAILFMQPCFDARQKGTVLVFSQQHNREGNEHDLKTIKSTFQDHLGLAVMFFEDKNARDTMNILQESSLREHLGQAQLSYVLVIILAHGNTDSRGEFFTARCGNEVYLEDFVSRFHNSNCPDVIKGKPKVFFMGPCRGGRDNLRLEADVTVPNKWIADVQDIYILKASVDKTSALRSKDSGTFFIRGICNIINRDKHVEIEVLRKRLAVEMNKLYKNEFKDDVDVPKKALIPQAVTTLSKEFRFLPLP